METIEEMDYMEIIHSVIEDLSTYIQKEEIDPDLADERYLNAIFNLVNMFTEDELAKLPLYGLGALAIQDHYYRWADPIPSKFARFMEDSPLQIEAEEVIL